MGPGNVKAFARAMYTQLMYLADSKRINTRNRNWYLRNKTRMAPVRRDWHLRKHFGITLQQETALVVRQKGRCPVCQNKLGKRVVDHDHVTGQVRGVLCIRCNTGLGMLRDCPERLKRALQYLRSSHAKH